MFGILLLILRGPSREAAASETRDRISLKLGVEPGERVAIYLNKRVEAALSYFGTTCAGAVFVPVNSSLKPPQVRHILRDCDVAVLVTTGAQAAGSRMR